MTNKGKLLTKKFEYMKNKAGKILTNSFCYGIILGQTERYRSGHNGTVLKTVVRLVRTVGSNPTLSATEKNLKYLCFRFFFQKRISVDFGTEDYSSGEEAPLLRE